MKTKTIIISLLILCLSVLSYSQGNNRIYLNPFSGNDTASGRNILYPIKTFFRAGHVAHGGDTILIQNGHYMAFKDSLQRYNGDTGKITIMPNFNATVTLDGSGATFEDWRPILDIRNSSNIDVFNLNIMNNNNGCGLRISSDYDTSKFIRISKCKVSNIYRQGILIQAKDITIDSCEVWNSALINAGGTLPYGWPMALCTYLYPKWLGYNSNITIRNNHVHDCWGEGIGLVRAKNFIVEGNNVHDNYSANIYMDNSVFGNVRNNFAYSTNDTHNRVFSSVCIAPALGIYWAAEGYSGYCADTIIEGINIYDNLLVRNCVAIGWWCDPSNLYPNNSYKNINIYYNTIYKTKGYESFYLDTFIPPNRITPTGCNFRNNILCKGNYGGIQRSYITLSTDYNLFTRDHNCFTDGDIPANFSGNISGYPQFLDTSSTPPLNPLNYRIPSTSNCNNAGVKINGITTDYWYAIRDSITPCIGFHEFGGASGISPINSEVPTTFSLYQNYPNPFNPTTNIKFNIAKLSDVKIVVYDVMGREVKTLVNESLKPGTYEASFDGSSLNSGVYFYKISAGDFIETKKMLIIK